MKCPECGHESQDKVMFSSACEKCFTWLHCCRCCSLFQAATGRCRSHTTEYSGPPEERNFCDEFAPGSPAARSSDDGFARTKFNRLFGEDEG